MRIGRNVVSGDFEVKDNDDVVLCTGDLDECSQFFHDALNYKKEQQGASKHERLASGWFAVANVALLVGLVAGIFGAPVAVQLFAYTISITFMILHQGHESRC